MGGPACQVKHVTHNSPLAQFALPVLVHPGDVLAGWGKGCTGWNPLENARSSFHLKVLNLISSAKSLWSCKVTTASSGGLGQGHHSEWD